jgi:protein tyrosine phosphatase (PTP) superfamily phosphohydrolase (DUF442 family)
MHRTFAIFPLFFAAVLFSHASAFAQIQASPDTQQYIFGERLHVPGIPNAGKISAQLYRGAQPHEHGLRELRNLGITMIVDLRQENKNKIAWEQETSESLGIRFLNIPVNGWAAPTDEQVAQFLEIFRDHPEEKVFVHCHFGDDRTGVFVAIYRMVFDKFPAGEALKEMNQFGFNKHWHPSMKAFVRDFPTHLQSSSALAPFKNSP